MAELSAGPRRIHAAEDHGPRDHQSTPAKRYSFGITVREADKLVIEEHEGEFAEFSRFNAGDVVIWDKHADSTAQSVISASYGKVVLPEAVYAAGEWVGFQHRELNTDADGETDNG